MKTARVGGGLGFGDGLAPARAVVQQELFPVSRRFLFQTGPLLQLWPLCLDKTSKKQHTIIKAKQWYQENINLGVN